MFCALTIPLPSLRSVSSARATEMTYSAGDFIFIGLGCQASGNCSSASEVARKSPPLLEKALAMWAIASGDGLSEIKCVAIFVATCQAVSGWLAIISIAVSASRMPDSGITRPRNRFGPGS